MRQYLPYIISLILFLIFNFVPQIEALTATSSLLETLILAGLAFVGVQLQLSRDELEKVKEEIETSRTGLSQSNQELLVNSVKLNELLDQFKEFDKRAEESIKLLKGTTDQIQEMINVTIKLLGNVPEVNELTKVLEGKEISTVTDALTASFQEYAKAWTNLATRLNVGGNRSAVFAWTKFIETCLTDEKEYLQKESRVLTYSKTYTKIVSSCCYELSKLHPDKEITVFLVTAMLPDEFFNWPQAEFCKESNSQVHIAHTWEGAEDYFNNMEKLSKQVVVKRCILVKSDENNNFTGDLPNLRSVSNLKDLSKLWIRDHPLTYSQLKTARMEHLFNHVTKYSYDYDDGTKIGKIKDFHFYPIGEENQFSQSYLAPTGKLLDVFINKLHSPEQKNPNKSNARYFILADDNEVKQALFPDLELLPELAMFKVQDKNSTSEQPGWLFGVIGYLTPFTEMMKIEFLFGNEMAGPKGQALLKLEQRSIPLQTMLNF